MKKKYIFLPVILTLFSLLLARAPDTLWTRTYGGEGCDVSYSVKQTNDGGFIIAGATSSFGARKKDVYLIRINSTGDTLWTKTYGGDKEDYGNSVQQTSNGGFIIAGSTESFSPYPLEVYLLRTDSNGDTIWAKTFVTRAVICEGRSVKQTTDRGYIIAGTEDGDDSAHSQVFIIKTDEIGDTIWTEIYGGIETDYGMSIQQTSDGGFIIAGYTYSFGAGKCDVYLIRTDTKGDALWTKTYGGVEEDCGNSVQQTSDGGFIVAGSMRDTFQGVDVYLIRTDSNGDTLWTKTYGGDTTDIGRSVQQTSDGGFIIAGRTKSFGAGKGDVYLIRTDSNGDTIWTNTYGGIESDEGWSVQQTEDGGYIIAGMTSSFGAGENDVYLIRLDKETIGIQDDNPYNFLKTTDFIISSNQENISIRYTILYSTSVKLEAYDTQGKLVKVITDKFINKGSYSVNWESNRFGAGIYFIKLSVDGSAYSKKLTIIK